MYKPRRGRRGGFNLVLMGLMMGASILLPMVTGQGGNPLEMFGLGGLLGGDKKKDEPPKASTATASSSSTASRKGPLVLDVPRIQAKPKRTTGPAAPQASYTAPVVTTPVVTKPVVTTPASAPAAPRSVAAAPAPAPVVVAAVTPELGDLKRERDRTYVELRSALASGDPQRIHAASVAHTQAARALQDAKAR